MRKAQLKMGETIAVLIVFFMLLMFGLVFYAKFKEDSMKRSAEELQTFNAVDVATRVSMLPEIQCTALSIECGNSLDLYKLKALSGVNRKGAQTIPGNPYYDLFHASLIIFNETYPTVRHWVIYNYTMNKTSYEPIYLPMTVHNPISGDFYFGYLMVRVYA
jgi:hypothetical protein